MSNLLLENDKRAIRRDYLIRLFSTSLLLLSAAIFIGAMLLLPSFFLIESKKQALLQGTVPEESETSEEENPRSVIRNTDRKLGLLSDVVEREKVSVLLTSLIGEKPSGVTLTSISYTREGEGGSFIVNGVAETRSTLINFSNAIERHGRFAEVNLPVSNLASNRDILFSLSFTVIP